MSRVAFYAPMKPPTHPVASGDRTMARGLITALEATGARVDLASEFVCRDGSGDPVLQSGLKKEAVLERARLIPKGKAANWRVWITYHNYYKAPDLIGPAVSRALKIPYLLVEATRARKRLSGAWAEFAKAAEAATDCADVVLYLTTRDAESLTEHRTDGQLLMRLNPFLPLADLPEESEGAPHRMLSVGMMRKGDKLESYRLVACSLSLLKNTEWCLDIAGDGPARQEVTEIMKPFGCRVHLLGAIDQAKLHEAYRAASILFWPGVNEAFGMTYLEAQARGLTVLAQNRPGVRDVLAPGVAYPAPEAGAEALAARLDMLLASHKLTTQLGQRARQYVRKNHLIDTARDTLKSALKEVLQ